MNPELNTSSSATLSSTTYGNFNGQGWLVVGGPDPARKPENKLPDKVVFQDATETVVLKFGDKVSVVSTHDDAYSREYGFLLAYFQAKSGLSKRKANQYIESLRNELSQDKKTKKRKE